tara:strand:- start:77 stop:1030 length:954 start_codon:yes stop_codon:yes gene_type:complete
VINNKKLILLPCFNEEQHIDKALSELEELLKIPEIELLAIDDGSTDNTFDILVNDNRVDFVLKSNRNQGLAKVFKSAQKFVIENEYDFLIIYDCDSQYPAKQILDLVKESKYNDIVIGCRNFKNNDIFSNTKNLLQRIGSFAISKIAGIDIGDVTSGFRLFNKFSLEKITVTDNFTYTIDTLLQSESLGLKIGTIKLDSFNKTRDSRLFKSNFYYLLLTTKTIINSFMMYREKFIMNTLYTVNLIVSFMALSRFFVPYFRDGQNPGNIQSLIFGTFLLLLTFIFSLIINQKLQNKKIDALLIKDNESSHLLAYKKIA